MCVCACAEVLLRRKSLAKTRSEHLPPPQVTTCDGMTCTRRKLDDLVKRLRLLVVHMFILEGLRNDMRATWWWRRPARKAELLEQFDKVGGGGWEGGVRISTRTMATWLKS